MSKNSRPKLQRLILGVISICVAPLFPTAGVSDEQPGRTDLYGDAMPKGAIARLGTVRYRNGGWNKRVVFLPHSETLVIGTPQKTLRFWQARTGKPIREISFVGASLASFAVAPHGKTIATVTRQRIRGSREYKTELTLWDAKLLKKKKVIPCEGVGAGPLAFTPDSKLIATLSGDGSVRLLDAPTGKELRRERVDGVGRIGALAISPNGNTIAVAGRNGVFLWDWLTEKGPEQLDGLPRGAMSVAFSPDSKRLATGSDHLVGARLFDVASRRRSHRLKGRADRYYVEGAAFDPKGRFLAVPAYVAGVELWDVKSGNLVKTFAADRLHMRDVAFSSNGKLLAGITTQSTFRVWDLETGESLDEKFVGHHDPPHRIEFTPDGKSVVSGDSSGVLRLWDARSGKPIHSMGRQRWVAALAMSPRGKHIVSAGHDRTLRVWERATGKQVFKLHGHGDSGIQHPLTFSRNGQKLFTFGSDMYLRVWNLRTGKALIEHAIRPQDLAVANEEAPACDPFHGGVGLVARHSQFAPQGNLLLIRTAGVFHVFDVKSGQRIRSFSPPGNTVQSYVLSPDGKKLVTLEVQPIAGNAATGGRRSHHSTVRVIDFSTNKVIRRRQMDGYYFREMCFSADGKFLALTGYDNDVQQNYWTEVRKVETGQLAARLPGRAMAITFSPDSKWLATTGEDTSILIWNLTQYGVE